MLKYFTRINNWSKGLLISVDNHLSHINHTRSTPISQGFTTLILWALQISTSEPKMSKKQENLTHEEMWDDSALIDSWNEALQEYKVSMPMDLPRTFTDGPLTEISQHTRQRWKFTRSGISKPVSRILVIKSWRQPAHVWTRVEAEPEPEQPQTTETQENVLISERTEENKVRTLANGLIYPSLIRSLDLITSVRLTIFADPFITERV